MLIINMILKGSLGPRLQNAVKPEERAFVHMEEHNAATKAVVLNLWATNPLKSKDHFTGAPSDHQKPQLFMIHDSSKNTVMK